MSCHKVDYESLRLQYLTPNSLMYKKLRIVDSFINEGNRLLDIGAGTGELIELERQKFNEIYGIDTDEVSIRICSERFENNENIIIRQSSIDSLKDLFVNEEFDCITLCDVLEHIQLEEATKGLQDIYSLLRKDGRFIFTAPGVFEKIKIALGKSPTHKHSHSSYGWAKMIKDAGFRIRNVETVEFPLIHSDFLRKKLHLFSKCCLIVAGK